MFNQISSKFAIMFLLAPFTLTVDTAFPISICKVKNSVFRPKIYISSHSEHVQPNFVKLGNIKYKIYIYLSCVQCFMPSFVLTNNNILSDTLTYSNFAILLLGLEYKHFDRKITTVTLHTQLYKNYVGNT